MQRIYDYTPAKFSNTSINSHRTGSFKSGRFFNSDRRTTSEAKQMDTNLFLPMVTPNTENSLNFIKKTKVPYLLTTMKKTAIENNDFYFGMDVKEVNVEEQQLDTNFSRKRTPEKMKHLRFYHDNKSPARFRKGPVRADYGVLFSPGLSPTSQSHINAHTLRKKLF
jgi:hypothetical protein